jgi:hypothetical protein
MPSVGSKSNWPPVPPVPKLELKPICASVPAPRLKPSARACEVLTLTFETLTVEPLNSAGTDEVGSAP